MFHYIMFAQASLLILLPSAREWLCHMGLPRSRTSESSPGSLQTILMAAKTPNSANERTAKGHTTKFEGV